jgi:hypothetical protein
VVVNTNTSSVRRVGERGGERRGRSGMNLIVTASIVT